MEILSQLFNVYPELTALILVIIIDWLFPFPAQYSPSVFFRLLASSISSKVAQSGSQRQQTLAGFLSIIVYLFLIGSLLFSVLFISTLDVWTHALLLYLSLGYQSVANINKEVKNLINKEQNTTAKALFKNISPFDVNKLSKLGINKLALEINIIYFVSSWLVPIVLFLFLNGIAALLYRALFDAYLIWHPIQNKTKYFGKAIKKLIHLIELPFCIIFAPIFSILRSSPNWFKLVSKHQEQWQKEHIFSFHSLIWLSIISSGLKSELAGPLMVDGKKVARARLNQAKPINETAITELLNWLNRFRVLCLLFFTCIIIALTLNN